MFTTESAGLAAAGSMGIGNCLHGGGWPRQQKYSKGTNLDKINKDEDESSIK